MARDIFSEWDKSIDTEGLQKDIQDAANGNGGGNYKEVPHGTYEVEVNQMELKASKKGDPMLSIWFKIVEGEYKGSFIFYNQVITQGFQLHQSNEMLRALVSEAKDAPMVEFIGYRQYHELIMDIHELIDGAFEYALKYDENNKGYSTFEITEVYELE